MRPLILTDDPPKIRRWCEECKRFTESAMGGWYGADEICAEHDWRDDEDD